MLRLSLSEALRFGHNYIGTEHVLLGLMPGGGRRGRPGAGGRWGRPGGVVRAEVVRLLAEYQRRGGRVRAATGGQWLGLVDGRSRPPASAERQGADGAGCRGSAKAQVVAAGHANAPLGEVSLLAGQLMT